MTFRRAITTSPETRYDKGLAVQEIVFSKTINQMYERSPEDQLHMQRLISYNHSGMSFSALTLKNISLSKNPTLPTNN